jgi:Cytosol aminopeptidase family, N-terminal domain
MRTTTKVWILVAIVVAAVQRPAALRGDDGVKETLIEGPDKLAVKVRMEGPYTADTPLQVVCYFKYTAEGVKRMAGAPVELDKHLGGAIGSLRERGEFVGDDLETLLLAPPEGSIKAKALLLIGLGDEATLSAEKMERVGRVALREAKRLGVKKAAFAPLIRDQGNSKIPAGEIARMTVRGVLLARDTEGRLGKEGLGKSDAVDEWAMEAGPTYFDETVEGVRKAVREANDAIAARPKSPYAAGKK